LGADTYKPEHPFVALAKAATTHTANRQRKAIFFFLDNTGFGQKNLSVRGEDIYFLESTYSEKDPGDFSAPQAKFLSEALPHPTRNIP